MRWPLVWRRSHDETVAAKDRVIEGLDATAAMYCAKYKARGTEVVRQAKMICDMRIELDRLRKLVPDRDAKGHFVPRAKEVGRG